jgi:hypothetical protein
MKCYTHPTADAVATCSNGCGRSLCAECADKYDSPLCDRCVEQHHAAVAQELHETRASLKKKMTINGVIFGLYVFLLISHSLFPDTNWLGIFFIPIIVWAFKAFKWLMGALLYATNMMVFASMRTWGFVYFIGVFVMLILGIIIIPIMLLIEWREYRKLA